MARYDEGVWHRYGLEGPGPEKYRTFYRFPPFIRGWERLGLGDNDLLELESIVMSNPEIGAVVKGTGGLRKMRFAPISWKTGKSGAVRVYYGHYPDYGIVVIAAVLAKTEAADLSADNKAIVSRGVASFIRDLERSGRKREGTTDGI